MRLVLLTLSVVLASVVARPQAPGTLDGMELPPDLAEKIEAIREKTMELERKEADTSASQDQEYKFSPASKISTNVKKPEPSSESSDDGATAEVAAKEKSQPLELPASAPDEVSDIPEEESELLVLSTTAPDQDSDAHEEESEPLVLSTMAPYQGSDGPVEESKPLVLPSEDETAETADTTSTSTEAALDTDAVESEESQPLVLIKDAETDDEQSIPEKAAEDSEESVPAAKKSASDEPAEETAEAVPADGNEDGSQSEQLSEAADTAFEEPVAEASESDRSADLETSTLAVASTTANLARNSEEAGRAAPEPPSSQSETDAEKDQDKPVAVTEPKVLAALEEGSADEDPEYPADAAAAPNKADDVTETDAEDNYPVSEDLLAAEEEAAEDDTGNEEPVEDLLAAEEEAAEDDTGNEEPVEGKSADEDIPQGEEEKSATDKSEVSSGLQHRGGAGLAVSEDVEMVEAEGFTLDKVYQAGIKAMLQNDAMKETKQTMAEMRETRPQVMYRFGNHKVTIRLSELHVVGVDKLKVLEVVSDLERMILNVTLEIPIIELSAQFNATGSISGLKMSPQSRVRVTLPKYGDGKISARVSNTKAVSTAQLVHSPNDMKIAIEMLAVNVTFGDPIVNIERANIPPVLKKMQFNQLFKVAFTRLVRNQLTGEIQPTVDAAVYRAVSSTLDRVALHPDQQQLTDYQKLVTEWTS